MTCSARPSIISAELHLLESDTLQMSTEWVYTKYALMERMATTLKALSKFTKIVFIGADAETFQCHHDQHNQVPRMPAAQVNELLDSLSIELYVDISNFALKP